MGPIDKDEAPASVPPSLRDEAHSFALAEDGTRLFVRSLPGSVASMPGAGAPEGAATAFLCDGILCDGFIWKYLWRELPASGPVVHWHYRGHGRSAKPADPDRIDIAAHADDLNVVRKHAGDPPAVLIGHSMGCQVALECYHRHPDRVRGLVLMCGSFGKVTSTFHGVPILDVVLPKLLDAAEKAPEVVRAIWSRIPSEMALKIALRAKEIDPARINPDDMLPYLKHMTHVDFPMFLRMLRAAGEHTAGEWLTEIKVPTLIVAGERDTFTPAFLAQRMAEAIPGAELLVVPGGTHVAPLEEKKLVNDRVAEFLRDRVNV